MAKFYSTGDAVFGGGFTALIRFPTSQLNWVYSVFLGALNDLADVNTWVTGGETTPDEAAEIFDNITFQGIAVNVVNVGDIKFSPSSDVGSNWLACNGAAYHSVDLPALFAVIGTSFNVGGETPGDFRVPDMRGRVLASPNDGSGRLPAFGDAQAGTGGESEHTLITAEMPAHTHTDTGHSHTIPSFLLTGTAVPPPLDAGTELPVSLTLTGSGSANLTNTGGDGAHNNVQPTLIIKAYILAVV